MANKSIRTTYGGMNQDISRSKMQNNMYFEAKNMKLTPVEDSSFGSMSNAYGNELAITLPTPVIDKENKKIIYGDKELAYKTEELNDVISVGGKQQILGHTMSVSGLIILSTDNKGVDCIWEVNTTIEGNNDIRLIYLRNMGFKLNYQIQVVYNYENSLVQKIYWVDGINMLRTIQVKNDDTINSSLDVISSRPPLSLPSPKIIGFSNDGQHKAGVIQYGYSIYNLNGVESQLSPLSALVPLDKGAGKGGAELGETTVTAPIVSVSGLPLDYKYIKLFSIKYTTYNGVPSVNLIYDGLIGGDGKFEMTHSSPSIVEASSVEQLLFLGNEVSVPRHIEVKDNILLTAHNTSSAYILDMDARAYSYEKNSENAVIHTDVYFNNKGSIPYTSEFPYDVILGREEEVPTEFDCVNLDFDRYRYLPNSTTEGGRGKFFDYELITINDSEVNNDSIYLQFFKDNEIYRIGLVFNNYLGQATEVKWMADFKAAQGNLEGRYNALKVSFNQAYLDYVGTLPEDKRPVSFNIVRALRRPKDRTISVQGILTGMMVQKNQSNTSYPDYNGKDDLAASLPKMPISLTRGYVNSHINPLVHTEHNKAFSQFDGGTHALTNAGSLSPEIHTDSDSDYKEKFSWQYTKMFQMHTPEASLNFEVSVGSGDSLVVLGSVPCTTWHTMSQPIVNNSVYTARKDINSNWAWYTASSSKAVIDGTDTSGFGLLGPRFRRFESSSAVRPDMPGTRDPSTILRRIRQVREFDSLQRAASQDYLPILGSPEVTEITSSILSYNNDSTLQYTNDLTSFRTDRYKGDTSGASATSGVTSMLSTNDRCITIVLEGDNIADRKGLDDLYNSYGGANHNSELIAELRKPKSFIYSGAIYNGYTYSQRAITEYVIVGDLLRTDSLEMQVKIISPGDTFVQTYKNNRLSKSIDKVSSGSELTVTERLEFKVETSVNLLERNDDSLNTWDYNVDPLFTEANRYNKVYSTENTLRTYNSDDTRLQNVKVSETEIKASKVKVPGEFIDSWLDILPNEVINLDGKYGPINRIITYNDYLYAFQDDAVARVAINPRLQTVGTDGVEIELGKGNVLYGYNYVTTTSGSVNKWGIVEATSGLYYIDANNKLLQRIGTTTGSTGIESKSGVQEVSEAKGLHTFFKKHIDIASAKEDNVLLGDGIKLGYDKINGDIFTSIIKANKGVAHVSYNEKLRAFTSIFDYYPREYLNKGEKFYSVGEDLNKVWAHTTKYSQLFYNNPVESNITLLINTDTPGTDKVFNSIEYDSEVKIEGIDQANSTLTSIEAWNNYQKTGIVPLTIPDKLRRRFRTWRTHIPREEGTRNRMRDKWIYIKLGFNPKDNSRLILHDILINYSE